MFGVPLEVATKNTKLPDGVELPRIFREGIVHIEENGKERTVNKQLLDEVFVIFRIIKVEVRVISQSPRLRLITLTETLIILDISKTESNNCREDRVVVTNDQVDDKEFQFNPVFLRVNV